MAIKTFELQDSSGNIYYPHTRSDVIVLEDGTTKLSTSLLEGLNILTPIAGSTTNTILLEITNFINNKKYSFKANANSTGNVTINGKSFKKLDGTQIGSGGVKANKVYDFYYDGTADCVFILAKAVGTATVADVLAPKTFSNGDDIELTGTLALTGTAGVDDVISGKTFYNTDAKNIQTGRATIESLGARKYITGTITSSNVQKNFYHSSGNVFSQYYINVTGFSFTPAFIIVMVGITFFAVGNINAFILNGASYYAGQDYIFTQGQILIPVPSANTQYTYYIYG